jgi:superfamily II DNA helicase RecQ
VARVRKPVAPPPAFDMTVISELVMAGTRSGKSLIFHAFSKPEGHGIKLEIRPLGPPPAFDITVLKELIQDGFGIAAVKDWQLRSLQQLLEGKDIVVMAGTGSGKSLIFQGIVFARKGGIVLVIAPLTSLIYDQVQNISELDLSKQVEEMKKKGISAVALTSKTTEDDPELFKKAFIKCEFQMVYTSPEYLLKPGGEFMNKILPNPKSTFISRLITVAVDECHVALDWQGFRPKYKELFRLKECMLNIPWVCLSATLPPHYSRYIRRHLRLRNAVIVKHTVRRTNIRLLISKIQSPGLNELDILVPTTPGADIPPTLVYCDNKQTVRLIATHLRERLLKVQSLKDESLVRAYHSAIDEEPRKAFMDELKIGKSKFLICTDACGMGVDLRIIKRVVQWKLNSQVKLTNLWQRFGRGGRDLNINAVAILFAQKNLFLEPTDDAMEEVEDWHIESESANVRKQKKKQPNLCERSYYEKMRHPVRLETRDVTQALMQELWDQDPIAQTPPHKCATSWKAMDPALIHFINTEGCRHKSVLAYLNDDDVHGQEGPGCCDNCMVDESATTGRTCADPTLHGIPLSLSATYINHFGKSVVGDESSEMAAEALTDEELFVKVSKQRLDILEEELRIWRNTTWNGCPVRNWLLEHDFLTDKEISRIRRNASTIDSEKRLKEVLGTKSQAGGLSLYIQNLLQLIEQSLRTSIHLQPIPVLSPSPVRRPLVELSPATSSQAAIRFPWLKRSADIDNNLRAEQRQNREERHAKRMKNVQVAKPKKRKAGKGNLKRQNVLGDVSNKH